MGGRFMENNISLDGAVRFCAFAKCGEKKYACNMEANGLFELDENNCAMFLSLFSNEEPDGKLLFANTLVIDEKIMFVPESANNIYIYDVVTKEFIILRFNIDISDEGYDSTFKFSNAIEYRDYIYVLPSTYPFILKIKKNTWDMEYIKVDVNKYWLVKQSCFIENKLYMVSNNSPYILCFDFETEMVTGIKFSAGDVGGMSIIPYKNYFFIPGSNSQVLYVFDRNEQITKEYVPQIEGFFVRENQRSYASGFLHNEDIILVPMGANKILKFDVEKKEFTEQQIDGLIYEERYLACQIQDENQHIFYQRTTEMWGGERKHIFLNLKDMEAKEVMIVIKNIEFYKKCLIEKMSKHQIFVTEDKVINLDDLFCLINDKPNLINDKKESIGQNVFNYIKGM